MANYFFDTSALGKNYHPEIGTPKVEQLLRETGARYFISRLTIVEIQSVFAKKVREGVITEPEFRVLRRKFLADVTNRKFDVVKITGFHYQEAERLINKHSINRNLRTLDALQLAVAVVLRYRSILDYFVCADASLCTIAQMEGFSVINPEKP